MHLIPRQERYISTAQAAGALGVSVSTVKRWGDEGVLPAQKTAGGHRKLLRAEVLALARKSELPHHDLAELALGPNRKHSLDLAALRQVLLAALLRGNGAQVKALIRRAYRGGLPLEALADRVISPVMEAVGHGWESAKIDAWHEHRGHTAARRRTVRLAGRDLAICRAGENNARHFYVGRMIRASSKASIPYVARDYEHSDQNDDGGERLLQANSPQPL
jgi:excisionase family DNA binding protein